jgi:hypothetical protein
MNDKDIDDVLAALSVTVDTKGVPVPEDLNRNNIMEKILETISTNIEKNNELMETALQVAVASGDPEHMEGYAVVAKVNSDMLKTLATLQMEQDKLRQQKELKEKELALKEKLAEGKITKNNNKQLTDGAVVQNNFLFTATREQIFDLLKGKPEDQEEALQEIKEQNPPTIDV